MLLNVDPGRGFRVRGGILAVAGSLLGVLLSAPPENPAKKLPSRPTTFTSPRRELMVTAAFLGTEISRSLSTE